jgi:hypothetical protein
MAGCFCFANPSGFLFGLSQKGTICSSEFVNIAHINIDIEIRDNIIE